VKIFIEGPYWSGRWTEIIADTLQQAGHQVGVCYHNRKGLRDRMVLAGRSLLPGERRKTAWVQRHRRQLLEAMSHDQWDALLSIQGTVDYQTVAQCRRQSPGLKVFFWWGDILTQQARTRISQAAEFSEQLLVSGKGTFENLSPVYQDQLRYFPFGVARRFHTVDNITARDRQRFSATVAFAGTCYPERCELINYLNAQLDTPVRVWGRGWRHCKGVRSHGPLSLADSLKVHACSRISLNLHHADTNNGCNMKFYEIPAAGGFQLCDWQPLLEETDLGRQTVACRSLAEFAEKTHYYLAHEQERRQIVETTSQTVFTTENYPSRLAVIYPQTN
jgi:spore maturation protein CgeB